MLGSRVGASVTVSLASAIAVGLVVACSSSGGGGSSGGIPADPVAQCQQFFTLTQDCYAKAGQQFPGNSANCQNTAALDERTQGQIVCALESPNAYCNALVAGLTKDAGALNLNDPELRKLNQCNAEKTTTGDCRLAVQKLGECGGTYYFPPECTGRNAAMAKCILDNPTGACALYAPREGGTMLPPEAQTFQQCLTEAAKVPDPEEEDAGL
jgi:hypothetical protein